MPFLLVLEASERTLTPQACQPQPQVGVLRSPRKRLALSSEPTRRNSARGRRPLLSRSPGLCPDESCLTSSVLTFPKRCLTGFVLTVFIYKCCACLGSIFCFPHQQTGLKSHLPIRRTQVAVTFLIQKTHLCGCVTMRKRRKKKKRKDAFFFFFLGSSQSPANTLTGQ